MQNKFFKLSVILSLLSWPSLLLSIYKYQIYFKKVTPELKELNPSQYQQDLWWLEFYRMAGYTSIFLGFLCVCLTLLSKLKKEPKSLKILVVSHVLFFLLVSVTA